MKINQKHLFLAIVITTVIAGFVYHGTDRLRQARVIRDALTAACPAVSGKAGLASPGSCPPRH